MLPQAAVTQIVYCRGLCKPVLAILGFAREKLRRLYVVEELTYLCFQVLGFYYD
jgi:hypothetical protein